MARRRKLNWGPVLWLATVANVSLGLVYSPVTSAARVRVEGALPTDQDRIQKAIQGVRGRPALRSGADAVQEELYRRPDLRTAEWSQNLFRRALLKVRYDAPVARLDDRNTVLTARGQISQTAEPIDHLPRLTLFAGALEPAGAFASNYESLKIADVCSRASTLGVEKLWITVQANGAVCLNSGNTGRVSLGSPDDLDGKFEKLQEILTAQPQVLAQHKEVVLLAPGKPMVRALGSQ